MPLTPEEVQNKEFTTVRLREGYDMQEVDDFLDEVETELARLYRENDELREKLGAVTRGGSAAGSAAPVTESPVEPVRAAAPTPAAQPAAGYAAQSGAGGGGAGGQSDAAAKVLALAQKTADELVADAKAESERLLSDARSRSEQLDADTRAKSSKIEAEARQRAESIEADVQARRTEVFGKLDAEKADLERELETLRSFEREYRSRLKSYLENELRKLEVAPVADSEHVEYLRNDSNANSSNAEHSDTGSAQSATTTGGSLRSVASLLEDDQH